MDIEILHDAGHTPQPRNAKGDVAQSNLENYVEYSYDIQAADFTNDSVPLSPAIKKSKPMVANQISRGNSNNVILNSKPSYHSITDE